MEDTIYGIRYASVADVVKKVKASLIVRDITEKINSCDIIFVTVKAKAGLPYLFVFANTAGKSPAFAA